MLRENPHMHLTVPVPEDNPRVFEIIFAITAHGLTPPPEDNLLIGYIKHPGGVAAKMLIGKEENHLALIKGPGQHLFCI